MKKLRILLLMALVITVIITGCNKKEDTEMSAVASANETSSTSEEMNSGSEESSKVSSEEASTEVNKPIDFEEITVVDNEECTIKIISIDPDNIMGYTLNAYFENKNPEKKYMFSVKSAYVNGVNSDPFFAAEVDAGKKANKEIYWRDDVLKDNNIEFKDIEINFEVHDSQDWAAGAVASETVHVYPEGKDKAEVFIREPKDTDKVLVDNDKCKVTLVGIEDDPIWGYSLRVFLENKTDKSIMFTVDDVSVNGFMIDPFWAHSFGAKKVSFSTIGFSKDDLEKNGIKDIKEITNIEMVVTAYDSDDYSLEDYMNEKVTITP